MHPEPGLSGFFLAYCDLGLAKPEPGIFRHASQVSGLESAGG
jgi:hypothetical protein